LIAKRLYYAIPSLYSASVAIINMGSTLKIIALGGGSRLVALSYLLYNTGFTLSSWITPYALRGTSRKCTFCICIFLIGVTYLAISFANNALAVAVLQLPYGFLASLAASLQTSIFVELLHCKQRGVYTMYLFGGLGFTLGGLLSGIIRRFASLSTVLEFATLLAIAASVLCTTVLPRTLGVIEASKVVSERGFLVLLIERARLLTMLFVRPRIGFPRSLLRALNRTIPLFLTACSLVFVSIMMFFSTLPVYLRREAHVPESIMLMLPAVSGAISTSIYAVMSRRGIHYVTLWKIHIAALIARTMLFASPIAIDSAFSKAPIVLTFYAFVGLTWAFIGSAQSTIMVHLAEPGRREERLGHLNASISLGSIVGSLVASLLSPFGYYIAFIVSSLIMGVAALVNTLSLRTVAR